MIIEDTTSALSTIERFEEFVKACIKNEKSTIKTSITPESLIFHRDFARYRHLPFPKSTTGIVLPGYMESTWINVILFEARTKQLDLKKALHKFHPLNNKIALDEKATISDLLKDLSEKKGDKRGENVGKAIPRRMIDPILNGIQLTTGFNFSDNNHVIPATTLKLISLLYIINKGTSIRVFDLINSLRDTDKYSLEFANKSPSTRSEENSLLIEDLISYLNMLIPTERLHAINQVILDAEMMWNTIAAQNLTNGKKIRSNYNQNAVNARYRNMAESITQYRLEGVFDKDILPAETMQTLLRTLHFRNSIGEYLNIFYKHHLEINSVKSFTEKIEDICNITSKEKNKSIYSNDKIISINEFDEFILKFEKDFRYIFQLAKGTYARTDQIKRHIRRAKILLLLYIFNTYQTTDTDKCLISISNCAAALYTVGIQMNEGELHSSFVFGQKSSGESILTYFDNCINDNCINDNCMNIKELIANDNIIPPAAKHIMYRKFCQTQSYMTGDSEGHDSFMSFQNEKLKKILECLNSNNAEIINNQIIFFLGYCEFIAT